MFHQIRVFFQALVLVKIIVSMYFQLEWKTVWIPICYNTHTTLYWRNETRGYLDILLKGVCFSRLLKCLRNLYGKQCGPRSDCSYRSSLFWVHTVCFYTKFISNVRQLFAAEDFSRRHFQIRFFLCALRVKYDSCNFSYFSCKTLCT